MAVSTQVVVEDHPQVFSMAQMNNASVVDTYKEALNSNRLVRIGLVGKIKALIDQIQSLIDARAALADDFRIQADQNFPEFSGRDLSRVIASLPADHPLVQLMGAYTPKLMDMLDQLHSQIRALDDLYAKELEAEEFESTTLSSYADFARTASTSVPGVGEIEYGLPAVDSVPVDSGASLIAQLPAIEELDADAADRVMMQSMEQGVDLSRTDSYQAMPDDKYHNVILGLGVAALAYLFLGGNK